jgi:hypothetical protein
MSYHGFLRDRQGRFRRIDVPRARGTAAADINDHGHIVGYYSDTNEYPLGAPDIRGFLLDREGRFARIDIPGAKLTQPLSINNHGRSPESTSTPPARRTALCAAATASSPRSTSPTPWSRM